MRYFLIFFTIATLSSLAASANIIEQTTRNEHMRNCLSRGGQKEICLCSFEKAKGLFAIDDLLDLNRRLSSNLPADPDKVKILTKATAKCVKDLQRRSKQSSNDYVPVATPGVESIDAPTNLNPLAIPVPPPPEFNPQPPKKEELEPIKEIVEPIKTYRRIGDNTNVSEQEYLHYLHTEQPNKNSAHFSEYNQIFFDSVARGDIQGLIAGAPLVKNFNMRNPQGYTPLMVASMYGQPTSAQFLLDKRAKVREKTKQGQTALHIAAFSGQTEMVKFLLDNKAKIAQSYGAGYQAIHLAVLNGSIPTINALLTSGADINAKMEDGNQPIHLAMISENPQLIDYLLSRGANIDATNNLGQTPLMLAAQENKPLAAQTLLARGASYRAMDALGKTAATIAQERRHNAVIGVFLTHQERVRMQQFGLAN